MRRASVPVFGYLSFLASNSAIANDLIALADHLNIITPFKKPRNYNQRLTIASQRHTQRARARKDFELTLGACQRMLSRVSCGTQKPINKRPIRTPRKRLRSELLERLKIYPVGRLSKTVATAELNPRTSRLERRGTAESRRPLNELARQLGLRFHASETEESGALLGIG